MIVAYSSVRLRISMKFSGIIASDLAAEYGINWILTS
jgi:hypothetical protein